MHNTLNKNHILMAISLIIFACLMRLSLPPLFPHLANFSPIGAIAIFSGILFRRTDVACIFIIACIVISDLVVNSLMYHQITIFYPGFYWQYASYLLIAMAGFKMRDHVKSLTLAYAGFTSAVIFYTISNFGVWMHGALYPKTLEGLIACYVAAIPFFQNTLASNLVYMAMLYTGYCVIYQDQSAKTSS